MPAFSCARLMRFVRVPALALAFGVGSSPAAHAQCETEAEARKTLVALRQEMADRYDAMAASRKALDATLDERAATLGWSEEKRQAVIASVVHDQAYASLERAKYELLFDVAAAKIAAEQAEEAAKQRAACTARQKVKLLMRKVADLDAEQARMLLERFRGVTR